jgi:hypothetical protein
MAGPVADCGVNRAVRFAGATETDDAAIRRLLRETPMHGAVTVGFEREPNYFRGANLAGGTDQTIVAFQGDKLVCMGRCTERLCWVNGRETRVGYLAELRLSKTARGRFGILREGYEYFRALQADEPAAVYFTSIAADNDRARRLLERGVRGLPKYEFLSELETVLIAVPSRPRPSSVTLENASRDLLPAIVRFLNEISLRHQLAPVWSEDILLDRLFVARYGGRIEAVVGLWDQRAFRQTVVRGYSPALNALRPVVNLVGRMFGTARLPRPGSVLPHAILSPLAVADPSDLPEVIAATSRAAAELEIEFLTIGLPANDGRLNLLRHRFSTRTWRSRLYRVFWPDSPRVDLESAGAPFLPEVALL